MLFKPITSEKAVKLIDIENTLLFEVDRKVNKDEIKKEAEKIFKIKIEKVRTLIFNNRKIVYIRLKKENSAADLATKLGVI